MQAIEQQGTQIGYGELLHQMHRTLKSMDKGSSGGGGGSILNHLMASGLTMDSMLVVGAPLDPNPQCYVGVIRGHPSTIT